MADTHLGVIHIPIDPKTGYYSSNKILSYNCKYNDVNSGRGIGKSHGEKWRLVTGFTQEEKRFMCLYRTTSDMNAAIYSWLEPLIHPPPNEKRRKFDISQFRFEGPGTFKNLYFEDDKEPMAYFRCIEHVNRVKQEVFNVKTQWAWLDEYLPIAWVKLRGVPNEGDALRTIVDTIDHDTYHSREKFGLPPVRVTMFGNFSNINSPLLKYFGVEPYKYGIYRVNRDVIVETVAPDMSKLSDTGGLSPEVRHCYLATDENSYVRPVPKGSEPYMSLRIGKHYYTFYYFKRNDTTFIKETKRHMGLYRYGTIDGMQENEYSIASIGQNRSWDLALRERANYCRDFYDSVYTKLQYLEDIS